MTATELHDRYRALGIRLWVESGELQVEAPPGVLNPELSAELSAHKAELLELLDTRDQGSREPPGPAPEVRAAAQVANELEAAGDRDDFAKPGPPRPPGIPTWGRTRSIRVVELARWRRSQQAEDPVVEVAAEGWNQWYPIQRGDLPSRKGENRHAVEPPTTTPVITPTTLRTPAAETELALPAPAEGLCISSIGASAGRRWRCGNPYCLNKGRWWMSRYCVVQCASCKPPGFLELVVAEGDAANAPAVEPNCFRQAVDYPRSIPATTGEPGAVGEPSTCECPATLSFAKIF